MKNKLVKDLEAIKIYQEKEKELKKIEEEKEKIVSESEYNNKLNEIIKALFNEGIVIVDDMSVDKSFDELLEDVDKLVQEYLNKPLDFDETELIEFYNELSEEEKNSFGSYDAFKKKILDDYKKEEDAKKTRINNLVGELKKLKGASENVNQRLQELENRRKILLNERWSMLQNELKNHHVSLLENGLEYKNGFPIIRDDMPLVNTTPKLNEKNFSVDDLVMVHATKFFPEDGVIKSRKDSTGDLRNTVHTALNGRVSSHMYGNWDDCSIVILDPLREHIDQVECIYAVDTFTYGSVKLSDEALILIDASQFDKIYQNNKEYIDANKDRIILYFGDNTIIIERLLSLLGYVPERSDQWAWENKHDTDILNNYVHANYPDKLNTAHDVTPHSLIEKNYARREVLASFGITDDGNDIIISPKILYALRVHNSNMATKDFIINAGVLVNDNEIHLLGTKDRIELLKNKQVSDFQIEKIDLLVKKYGLMEEYQKQDGHSK